MHMLLSSFNPENPKASVDTVNAVRLRVLAIGELHFLANPYPIAETTVAPNVYGIISLEKMRSCAKPCQARLPLNLADTLRISGAHAVKTNSKALPIEIGVDAVIKPL